MDTLFICFGTFALSVSCLYFNQLIDLLRNKLDKSVQCWFCHVGSKVKYVDSNSWTCCSCGQYNGFSKDGDYNREIPSQYDDKLNIGVGTFSRCKPEFKRSNALCHRCNYNQELKIKQLASFVPLCEANYDKEIHHYKLQLEESYKLCSKCEQLVASVISSQRYVLPGPRRLANLTTKLVLKSYWSLYFSITLCILMTSNCLLTIVKLPVFDVAVVNSLVKYLGTPVTSQVFAGLGVVLHTLQCCQFGTYWSFVNWLVWAVMASSPQFLQSQLPLHVCYVQMAICTTLLISTTIILVRKKRANNSVKRKDEQRKDRRRKENSTAVWSSICHSTVNPCNESGDIADVESKRKTSSPVKLTPSSTQKVESKGSDRRNLVKPVARVPDMEKRKEDFDISSLSISSRAGNPFTKATSPWERVAMTRSSSFSSGISSLRTSPCSWKTTRDWRGSPDNVCSKSPRTSFGTEDWTKNSTKEATYQNRGWSPVPSYNYSVDWESKKTPWPTQVYQYPVAYAWPNVSPTPWDRSPNTVAMMTPPKSDINNGNKTNSVLSSLPTIILAATNACLVYYILNSKT